VLWKKQGPHFLWTVLYPELEKTESTKSEDSVFFQSISPPCLGLCFFSELKFLDYSRTNFLLFAGARVLDTGSDQTKFLLSVGDGATYCIITD
jgi:hypothetical protein